MRRSLTLIALLAGLVPLTARPSQAAQMWTGWEELRMSQEACLETARSAYRAMGFRPGGDSQTAFGWRGEDGISARCIADRGIVVFFVYTQAEGEGQQLLAGIRNAYRGGGVPRGGSKF